MFTGIVQGLATVESVTKQPGLRGLALSFPDGFSDGLQVGASVSVDGVCLTVTRLIPGGAAFDVMQQTLRVTTLDALRPGSRVNVERAAHDGAEIGGHALSGHVDCIAHIQSVRRPQNNHVLRVAVSSPWMRYLFDKGYVAVNGASLTIARSRTEPDGAGWFDVWLIPETLRMTTFGQKKENDPVNVELDRQTQILVDTVHRIVEQRIDAMLSASINRAAISKRGQSVMAKLKKTKTKTKTKSYDDPIGPHDDPIGPHDDPIGPHKKKKTKKKVVKKKKAAKKK